ncbi:hypothetical protein CVT24_001417 [Panaeolus cyanescens]|uniref:Uncharacterized protein n=1 Tax=Panaeolus cyanescens TaxID=181874 RepID=A0A409W3D7_9AGAR|nr:hypothetical protein CVT24_001417 [Panaeolus cyanescens]
MLTIFQARIYSLPPELLQRVFIQHRDTVYAEYDRKQRRSSSKKQSKVKPNWMTVTHVCHTWRNAALNSASLWSHIRVEFPSWTKVMLERSKDSLLTVTISHGVKSTRKHKDVKDMVSLALSQHHRLKNLVISNGDDWVIEHCIECLSGVAAPMLESVVLTADYPQPCGDLPVEFLDGGAPKLGHLALGNELPLWTSPLLSGLTSISMRMISTGRRPGGFRSSSPADFYEALARMSNLRSADFGSLFGSEFLKYKHPQRVHLPHLEDIHLQGCPETCSALLQNLLFPPSTSLDILVFDQDAPHYALPAYTAFGSSLIPCRNPASGRTPPRFQAFKIVDKSMEHKPDVTIEAWYEDVDFCERPLATQDDTKPASLRIQMSAIKGVLSMFKKVPWQGVHSLSLDANLRKCEWMVLAKLPTITTIHLPPGRSSDFLEFILSDPAMQGDDEPLKYFQNLQSINLTTVDFDFKDSHRMALLPSGGFEYHKFLQVLLLRRELELPIKRLRIFQAYNLFKDDVHALKEVVDDFYWDGMERERDNSNYYMDYWRRNDVEFA